jgi:AraC-like DNA-binding protein
MFIRSAVTEELTVVLKSSRGETLAYHVVFETLRDRVGVAEVVLATTLPRGGLQVLQTLSMPESIVKAYHRQYHGLDRLAWAAVRQQKPVRSSEVPNPDKLSHELLQPQGLVHALAVPVASPVLPGYPGVLVVFRTAQQGEFSDEQVKQVGDFLVEFNAAIRETLAHRGGEASVQSGNRVFVFDGHVKPLFPGDGVEALDSRVASALQEHVRQRLAAGADPDAGPDRVSFADNRGDHVTFRIAVYPQFAALADGPVVFASIVPECQHWALLRSADFSADPELARLIPVTRFITENFSRGPTLSEIAKVVHLSPFHFHRRFAELLGITPKHFLFDCQIAKAKRMLLERKVDLADIARECGFAHQSHFTSRFKQATGLTPTRWRTAVTMN